MYELRSKAGRSGGVPSAGSVPEIGRRAIAGRLMRANSGQSLIIALSVMFVLVFLGTIFVTMIGRNLQSAFRSGDVLTARQAAEAGISLAHKMLLYSEDGADWRPTPANLDPKTPLNEVNPDIQWLRPYAVAENASTGAGPTGGFTSFLSGNGRYLLKVSYNPDPRDPMSRYIKIESIGRVGVVDNDFQGSGQPDPTTLANSGPIRLRQELTAYQPIGITDYARFITNKSKRAESFSLGKAIGALPMQLGGRIAGMPRSAPVRVNGNLRWSGNVDLYLRAVQAADDSGAANQILPADGVEVAGEITADANADVKLFRYLSGATSTPLGPGLVSRAQDFSTYQGLYRDGSDMPDSKGYARGVKRLEPPLIDQEDPASGVERFLRVTRDSGQWVPLGNRFQNSGRFGWGDGLYIGNSSDTQQAGSSMFGGVQTLQTEWTHPDGKGNWQGDRYVPPGAVIHINPDATLTITRTDTIKGGRKYVWYELSGGRLVQRPDLGPTMTMPYPPNGVVYADGNIRISGVVAPNRQLTVVSNENIYIEGNVLKGDRDTSAISLLARKNIVVNTTQFLSLPPLASPLWESAFGDFGPPYAIRVTSAASSDFTADFSFGYWYSNAPGLNTAVDYPAWGDGRKSHLFVRQAGAGATASINLFLNGQAYDFGGAFNYLMSDPTTQWTPFAYEGQVFPLQFGAGPASLDPTPGAQNTLQIALHQTGLEQTRADYMLQSIAVLPMDINIQALMYAQDGSFFVIPGPWFNSNPEDTPDQMAGRGGVRPVYIKNPAFPFYGEPLDIKITVDGAVAENIPASEADVEAWLRKWSDIPAKYGSSGEDTAHSGEGITFLYDTHLGFPVGPAGPLRTDQFGRALPVTPKLPVSQDLIYVGRLSS
ncbi:MAG: hypothetical protein IT209_04550 [Armatimonadetes bacterium]|nr:hypothetical protein [Armatimonadota bacterium]